MEVIPCTVVTFLCVINIISAVEIINVENERAKGRFENILFYNGKKKRSYSLLGGGTDLRSDIQTHFLLLLYFRKKGGGRSK